MLNKIYTIWIGFLLVVMLVACGSNKTSEENADDKSSNEKIEDATASAKKTEDAVTSDKTKDKKDDKTDKSEENEKNSAVDEDHLKKFNEYITSGENWSRLLENRYFYVDGTKTYMPTTPREYQELFNTEFVNASIYYYSNLGVCDITFIDKDGNRCLLGIWTRGLKAPEDDKELLEFYLDQEIARIIPQDYNNDLFKINNITYNDVGGDINGYGYYAQSNMIHYIPLDIMAYYSFIYDDISADMLGEGYLSFSDLGGEEISYVFADITADGIPEMFINVDSHTYGFTFNKESDELVIIFNDYADGYVFDHNLCKYYEGDSESELAEYYLFDQSGHRELLVSQRRYGSGYYENSEFYVNDMLTTREEYDLVSDTYYTPRGVQTIRYHSFDNKMFLNNLGTYATLYYDSVDKLLAERDDARFQPYINQ